MDVAGMCEGVREGVCIPSAEYEKEKIGEYTLLYDLRKGEKAVVYLAVDSRGREVAIKAFLTKTELNFKEYSKYYFDEQGASKLAKRGWGLGKTLRHRHIQEGDLSIILGYLNAVKETLHQASIEQPSVINLAGR